MLGERHKVTDSHLTVHFSAARIQRRGKSSSKDEEEEKERRERSKKFLIKIPSAS
jgi:hypothetical protein